MSSVPCIVKLCAALGFFAEGGYQKGVGKDHEIALSQSTFSEVLSEVLNILEPILCPQWITWPNVEEQRGIALDFYAKHRIPGVVGCIDGTHVSITSPSSNKHLYYNRKGSFSLNVLLVTFDVNEEPKEDHKQKISNMSLDFIAGCLGGCAGVIVGHPLDTIKVHLQTQDSKNPKYRNTWHCFTTLLREEKLRGFYRGIASPMVGVGLINAIVFGIYGNVQRNANDPGSLMSHMYAGCAAGLIQSIVCSPIELAKTRMQLQVESSTGIKHSGPFNCLRYILRTEGRKGFFRGLGITALRDVPGFAAYFVSYEYMMRMSAAPTSFHAFVAGGLAGMCSWLACYPMDVIKTCLQAETDFENLKYLGIVDCIKKEYGEGGLRFFFRGFTPTMIRSFPANAACFFVVYIFMRLVQTNKLDLVVQKPNSLTKQNLAAFPIDDFHQQRDQKYDFNQRRNPFSTSTTKASNACDEAIFYNDLKEIENELCEAHETKSIYSGDQ